MVKKRDAALLSLGTSNLQCPFQAAGLPRSEISDKSWRAISRRAIEPNVYKSWINEGERQSHYLGGFSGEPGLCVGQMERITVLPVDGDRSQTACSRADAWNGMCWVDGPSCNPLPSQISAQAGHY